MQIFTLRLQLLIRACRSFWWLRVLVPCLIMTECSQNYILQSFKTSNLENFEVCFYVSMVSLSFVWTLILVPQSIIVLPFNSFINYLHYFGCKHFSPWLVVSIWTRGSAILMLNATNETICYKDKQS
ncbi:hypothetical protein E2542_SST19756 [Spatholobus suberectus]|nr:hypothetical protein E2542_SST19756 [Spatholobus suberectus]